MKSFQGPKFGIIALLLQIGFLLIFGFCLGYKDNINASKFNKITTPITETRYFYFQDVQGMMFLGFGFLMVFLQKYGYSSIGINFLLCVFSIEWALINNGVRDTVRNGNITVNGVRNALNDGIIKIDVNDLLNAEFTLATILISFGAVLGKLSPIQLMLMALIEIPIMVWNEDLGRNTFKAIDAGDTIFVHTFGAYFGLGCSSIISGKIALDHENEDSRYDSDLFAMIGTLVLWIFWPSFNAGGGADDAQQRAIVNTVISLCGSAFMTFIINSFITEDDSDGKLIRGKFKMAYIQNATLAGGVAVGACADLMIQPWGALLIGTVGGALSTLGFHYLTPALTKIYIHDTCGVHNLHGMPGIMGGIASSVAASIATTYNYGSNLNLVIKDMAINRTASQQAGYQLAALGSTIVISIAGGVAVGLLFRFIPICDNPKRDDLYSDERFWIVPQNKVVENYASSYGTQELSISKKTDVF